MKLLMLPVNTVIYLKKHRKKVHREIFVNEQGKELYFRGRKGNGCLSLVDIGHWTSLKKEDESGC
jgi:hypothetical protein